MCFLEDRPGTTNTGEAELLDFAAWTTQLVEKEAGDFLGEAAIPMQGTLTSSVTSTLSVICSVDERKPRDQNPRCPGPAAGAGRYVDRLRLVTDFRGELVVVCFYPKADTPGSQSSKAVLRRAVRCKGYV